MQSFKEWLINEAKKRLSQQQIDAILDIYTDPSSEKKALDSGMGLIKYISKKVDANDSTIDAFFRRNNLVNPITRSMVLKKKVGRSTCATKTPRRQHTRI